ncbi:MAG: hypothetical protein HRF43_19840 [Phycisphaerae bacterium]|jgi:nicotinate phosphoribosyltransferase
MPKFNLSDEYFNRSLDTVAGTPRESMPVCYAVFCRQAGVMCGVADIVDLLTDHCKGPVTLRGKTDGEPFAPGEVVLTLEGPFGELVTLETLYLGILSLSAAAGNMAAIVEAAGPEVKVIDMAARHYPPELTAPIALAAAVGGARGTSTQAGHAAVLERFGVGGDHICVGARSPVEFKLYGSIPHALNAVFEGGSIESAAAYHAACPDVPLTVLLDFEGCERDVCAEAVARFGSALEAVRLDTPANRIHQGGHDRPTRALEMRILSQAPDRRAAQEALDRYGFGPGVTIEAVYAIRDLLDSLGARSTRIVVSSGFDLEKVRAFRACRAPMDVIGTGSWVRFGVFTSDIVRVFENGQWLRRCKAGRSDELVEPEGLPVIYQHPGVAPGDSPA